MTNKNKRKVLPHPLVNACRYLTTEDKMKVVDDTGLSMSFLNYVLRQEQFSEKIERALIPIACDRLRKNKQELESTTKKFKKHYPNL